MLASKIRAIPTELGSPLLEKTIQPSPKISVIFTVAIAIRKFQTNQSNKFKQLLAYDFEKQTALDELNSLYKRDNEFFKQNFVRLVDFIRKFNFSFEDLTSIDDQIVKQMFECLKNCLDSDEPSNQRMLQFLCSALKFLTQNSTSGTNILDISSIFELCKRCESPPFRNALISLLGHYFEKLNIEEQKKNSELLSAVLNLPDLTADVRAFILNQLESNETNKRSNNKNYQASLSLEVPKVKKNKQVVSKSIQTVRSKQDTKHSEEADFQSLNLTGRVKNLNRKTNSNSVNEEGLLKSLTGDDRSMWRTTWGEVENLYLRVTRGEVLKDDDKDNYLKDKFLGYHFYFIANNPLKPNFTLINPLDQYLGFQASNIHSFFINRMCASVFSKVSRKQSFNGATIDKLMKCITDFDGLISILKLDKNFVSFFVDKIFYSYWTIKDLKSPDLAVNVLVELMNKTTEEYLNKGWIYNSTYVRRKSYDQKEVETIIIKEINSVRVDAIEALYNSAVRNKKQVLTDERLQKIREYAQTLDKDQHSDDTFTTHIFKLIELAETLDYFDYKDTFQMFYRHLQNAKSGGKLEYSLRFMTNQVRDCNRAKELFQSQQMTTFIDCLQDDSGLSCDQRHQIMKIICTYLEHEVTEPLSEENLEKLVDRCVVVGTRDEKLIKSYLNALLLSIDKTQRMLQKDLNLESLSQNLLAKLFGLYHSLIDSEDCTNFLVFILSRVLCAEDVKSKKLFLNDQKIVDLISNKMLCPHIVKLGDDDDEGERVQFEELSDEKNNSHSSYNKVSLLATKIIWRSVENGVLLKSSTIDNLILVLTCKTGDKQTSITAAKCLYGLTKYMSFDDVDYLNQLLDFINSPIYDVSIYVQTAYIRGCVKVADSPVHLDSMHMENICALYVTEDSLKIGQDDYKEEINENLFTALLYEAKKQEFKDNNLFLLFDIILNMNEKYALRVLAIILAYSYTYIIPEAIVRTLENLLSVSSYFEKAFSVLENVILGGKVPVTNKTFNVIADYLQLSPNSRLRFYSFKLLEQARQNQELPDSIFYQGELVRAGYALEQGGQTRSKQETVIEFIQKCVDKGVQLPIDTKLALEKEISNNTRVLKIFETISRNKQIIDQHLLNALSEMFDPMSADKRSINRLLVKIFENAIKNNQTLHHSLLDKLDSALDNKYLKQDVLPVFIYLAQKGEVLSQHVNSELLDKLMNEKDLILRQTLLSSLGSLIEANQQHIELYRVKINKILIREIKSEYQNIQKFCLGIIYTFVRITEQIDDQLLEELVDVGTDIKSNNAIKSEIHLLFQSVLTDRCNPLIRQRNYREKIELSNLSYSSPKDLLDQLRRFIELESGFYLENYQQLKKLVDSGNVELQEEVLNLLHGCSCKSEITDEFLDSVALIYESTMSETLKMSCLKLFDEAVESGKTLNGTSREIWGSKWKQDENLKNFLQSRCCIEMKQEFQLDNQVISALLQLIQEKEKLLEVNDLSDFITLIVEENLDYSRNDSFVVLIEQCILHTKILDITLPCYCRIIKELKKCNADCLQLLTQHFIQYEPDVNHLLSVFCESMYYVSKFAQLSDICVDFAVKNLHNINEKVRGFCFAIFRILSDHQQCKRIKNDCCEIILENLDPNVRIKVEQSKDYLDLLETILSVKVFDVEVFTRKESNEWKRELLISDIFEDLQMFAVDQVQFYIRWFTVEDKFHYDKSCEILSLIHKCSFQNIDQLMDLLQIITDLDFPDVKRILVMYGPEPFEVFKQNWCLKKLTACLSSDINEIYSRKLIKRLCSSFDINFIGELFCCIKSIDNLFAFEDIISFCLDENIDLHTIRDIENVSLSVLKNIIESRYLCRCAKCPPQFENQEETFLQVFQALKDAGWNFDQLRELVMTFNPINNKFQNLLLFLNTIESYSLPSSNFEKSKTILTESTSFQEIMQKVNKLIIENHFQSEGKVNDLNELLRQLKHINQSNEALSYLIKSGSLDIRKHIFENHSDKLNWTEKQISSWANKVKGCKEEFSDYEAIAIISRANSLITGHNLTEPQILCCLIALRKESAKGKLLEVATGEGKSTIICILAIISALRGKKVDVITSSPVLAERDAKQKAKLYRTFSLTCSHNGDKTVYLKGGKNCYLDDVVYGEMSQFQFDILRDIYSKLGTLAGRGFTTAIVDEVDSMLIDDSSKIARLSSSVPGMDHFHPIYVFIWQHLISLKERFIMFHNKMYFLVGKVGFEDGKITLEFADENGVVLKIDDLETYIVESGDTSQVSVVVDDIDDFLTKELETYLKCQIKENKIYIPSNFADFIETQKFKWITNAVEALNYQENVHYVVQDGQIKPVDYYSTGIVQSSTVWSDGLHQFLQLKHNLKMTSETLTTNFLSNIGLIYKYEQVYGLSGTLGSETARAVLKAVYNVDVINIPQRYQKQFMELKSAVIAENEGDWLKEILSSIVLEIQKDRGILVICETIEQADRINVMLKSKLRPSSVKLYIMNNMDQERNVENISPGEVIIATNLAGRGTDIRTDEIEPTGGLHVILSFMPSNKRVEDQAFGRTARQGKRGTGVMILNAQSLHGPTTKENAKEERDKIESHQLITFRDKELKVIQVKDKLFEKFCSFLNDEIRLPIRKENYGYVLSAVEEQWAEILSILPPTTYEICVLSAIEEQWAGFLSKLDEGAVKCENAEMKCNELIDQLRNDFKDQKLIKNPYYLITIANDILVNEWSLPLPNKFKRALEYFRKAISLEENYYQQDKDIDHDADEEDVGNVNSPGAAHLGIAWCLIRLKEDDYKQEAYQSLNSSLNCLSNEMSVLNATQLLLQETQIGFVNSDLYKQLNTKATILGSYIQGVSSSIDAIKRSKRMIDLIEVDKENDENVLETIHHFNEQERDEKEKDTFKDKGLKLSDRKRYSLTFNHLTRRADSGTIDQALITLKNAFDNNNKGCLKSKSKIQINLKQVDLAKINMSLFQSDKEFKDLTRESAIAKLKEERTYWHAFSRFNSYQADLNMKSSNKSEMNLVNKQLNELLKVVEDQEISKTDLRFDILIKKANENKITKLFSTSNNQKIVKLNIVFDSLDQESAMAKLKSIKASFCDVELVLHKSALLKLVKDNKTLNSGILCTQKDQYFEKIERKKLLNRLSQLATNETSCFIKFDDLSIHQAESIVESCHENVVLTISFKDIYDFHSSKLDDGQVNFSFDELNKKTAEMVINVLRDYSFEFSLEFKDLSDNEVKCILKHADLEQEDMEKPKVKNIRDLFMSDSLPTLEMNEFVLKGMEHILEINEKLFIPIRSVCLVAALGVGQVIVGGVLIGTAFGATVGMGLVTEGLADMFTAYRAFSTRQFKWEDYCKQKAVSLIISAVSMGLSSLKDGIKGAKTLTAEASREMLEQAGTKLVTGKQLASITLKATGKNLKSLSWKVIGVKTSEAVVREVLNSAIQHLADFCFDQLKPEIIKSVQTSVRNSFTNPKLLRILYKMYAIDKSTNSAHVKSKVEMIVSETINPRQDFMCKQWDSIALPLIKGILSDSGKYGSTISMAIRVIGTLNGLSQVLTLTNTVVDTLLAKLRLVDKDSMTISQVLSSNLKINKNSATVIANKLKSLQIIDEFDNFNDNETYSVADKIKEFSRSWESNREVMLQELGGGHDEHGSSLPDDIERSIKFLIRFHEEFLKMEPDSFNMIMGSVSQQIAEQLIRIMDSQLLQPWSTLAVSSLTDSLSKRVQHRLVNKDQNTEEQNADQKRYEKLSQKEHLTPEENEFMASYGKYRTFEEQINYNKRDYCKAYSQCEMIYYSTRQSQKQNPNKSVTEAAQSIRNGGPADIGVMMATAKLNGVNLKVVDTKDYIKTEEDIKNNTEVIYIEHGPNNQIGHAYYMDTSGQFVDPGSKGNDCYFGAFSKILANKGIEKSVSELREEAAQHMESNSESYSKVIEAQKWIRKNHPDTANRFTAGLSQSDSQERNRLRSKLQRILTQINNGNRSSEMIELVGCTYDRLSDWLEFTKQECVPENYSGRLHVDHFIPVSSFDMLNVEEIEKCWNYTNLRYLTAEDNLRKSSKQPTEVKEHNEMVKEYHTRKNLQIPYVYK